MHIFALVSLFAAKIARLGNITCNMTTSDKLQSYRLVQRSIVARIENSRSEAGESICSQDVIVLHL